MAHLNRELQQGEVAPTRIEIALHAGEAGIGHAGSAQCQKHTATDDTVNIASRAEGL